MKPEERIYWRSQGRGSRAYADFRDFADVGGTREALKAPGSHRATEDPVIAQSRLTARLEELKRLRRERALSGEGTRSSTLADVARQHLILKKEAGKHTDRWIACAEVHLTRACQFFGASRTIQSLGVADVQRWILHLERLPSGRGGTINSQTVRHHINSLSNLYRRAQSLELIPLGYNPVAALMEKPGGEQGEARWLEVHEAALLLELARTTTPRRPSLACPFLHPLLATMLLTGGRRAEVLGLQVDDVSFDRKTVSFRPNQWRRLKTAKSRRTVPLWPQLEAILRAHIVPMDRTPREGLLFPTENRAGAVAMISNFDKALDSIAEGGGWEAGEVRSRIFRNTYSAARLQTLDGGAPISPYTVSRELGHGSLAMVERIYGHLGTVRHRAKVVEYRVGQHKKALAERKQANSVKHVVTVGVGGYRKSLSRP